MKLKNLDEQVVVITGATSGIGLTTARMAAERGAKLVLAARNEDALIKLVNEINLAGGNATFQTADVADEDAVKKIAEKAIDTFGGFDTWVNNAGVSIYGRLTEVSNEDSRRLFDTNFWGIVNGSRVAAEHLREKGGALINVGSTLSERAIPIQGMYSASKHAVKGFTDALRMELEEAGAPISVTLIKPSSINTPYTQHAKNYMDEEPSNPPPVYAPKTVADAILFCAENPTRDVFVGGGGKALSVFDKLLPGTTDKVMEATIFEAQKTDVELPDGFMNLYESKDERLLEEGIYNGYVIQSSPYTKAVLEPLATVSATTVALGLGAAVTTVAALGYGLKFLFPTRENQENN